MPSVGASPSASTLRSPFQSPTSNAVAPAHVDAAGSAAQPVQLFDGLKVAAASNTWTFALPSGSPYIDRRSSLKSPVTSAATMDARPKSYSPSAEIGRAHV